MKKSMLLFGLVLCLNLAFSQSKFPKHQLSVNAFRNPSIGLEYQHRQFSVHAGYYLTNFTSGTTTEFVKTGVSFWYLPFGKNESPSALYAGTSYLRGLTRDYKNQNALALETGVKFAIYKGFQFRLGVIALASQNESLKINPTPSFNYSFSF
jgi:hypothetical protein